MKQRIFVIVILGIFFASLSFGIVKRNTYTDMVSKNNYLEHLQVALLPEKFVMSACKELEEISETVPIIVKVKAMEEIEHLFGISRQKVKILSVFRGNHLKKDMELYVYSNKWSLSLSIEPKSIERGFVNIMETEQEYLLFLDEPTTSLYDSTSSYKLYDDTLIAPVFGYKDRETVIAKTNKEHTYISYTDVKNNEFFCDTQLGHETWKQLKEQLFKIYH